MKSTVAARGSIVQVLLLLLLLLFTVKHMLQVDSNKNAHFDQAEL